MAVAREQFAEDRLPDKAFKAMPFNAHNERNLLRHLCHQPTYCMALPLYCAALLQGAVFPSRDFEGAFGKLSRGMRTMYLHAVQSYFWNNAASARIRLGLRPLVGDLVFVKEEEDGEGDDVVVGNQDRKQVL